MVAVDNIIDTTVMYWGSDENDNKIRNDGSMSSVSVNMTEDDSNRVIRSFQDVNGNTHTVMKLETTLSGGKKTKGKQYCKPRLCMACKKRARTMCYKCGEVHCYPI